jgi:hypothetical protein
MTLFLLLDAVALIVATLIVMYFIIRELLRDEAP